MPAISESARSSAYMSSSAPWHSSARRQRVQVGEAGQARQRLARLRVVLHGAGAERVEAGVDAVVPGGEVGEVADHLQLGQLRHAGQPVLAQERRGQGGIDAALRPAAGTRRSGRGEPCSKTSGSSWTSPRVPPPVERRGRLRAGRRRGPGAGARLRARLPAGGVGHGYSLTDLGEELDELGRVQLGGDAEQRALRPGRLGVPAGERRTGDDAAPGQPRHHRLGVAHLEGLLVEDRAGEDRARSRPAPSRRAGAGGGSG